MRSRLNAFEMIMLTRSEWSLPTSWLVQDGQSQQLKSCLDYYIHKLNFKTTITDNRFLHHSWDSMVLEIGINRLYLFFIWNSFAIDVNPESVE